VGLAYAALLSDILVDDAQRYIDELTANRFFWDLGHLWMQPLALLAHWLTGGVLGIVGTLEAVSVASVALGCAVFHDLLRRCGHGVWRSALATALVALSFNLMALGPTSHIKLMVFPALALALRHGVLWEQSLARGSNDRRHAIASGAWLGAASNLLVSVLPAGVLAMPALLWVMLRSGLPLRQALRRLVPYLVALIASGAGLLLLAYGTALLTHSTDAKGLLDFVFGGLKEKQDLHVGFVGWRETPFRFVFSLVNNFVYLPSLGPWGRAWLWGLLPPVGPIVLSLAWQVACATLSVLAIAAIVGLGLRRLRHAGHGLAVAWAYLAGATAFSVYYNLNDPEHWFQFTLPLVFIGVHLALRGLDRLVLGLWLATVAAVNLSAYGVPKATFALEARQSEARDALGPQGLYVGFAAYPGEPDSSMFSMPGIERFRIDLVQLQQTGRDSARLLALLDARVQATFDRGGRVLVFRALDPYDWRGPVMQVTKAGLKPAELRKHLQTRYRIEGPLNVGGFSAYELKPLVLNP
jgi:hypothetical protein